MLRGIAILAVLLLATQAVAQHKSDAGPHAWQERLRPGAQSLGTLQHIPALHKSSESRVLTHTVMGYHPYWRSNDNITRYRFDLLSHVVYFSAGVDPATGVITTSRDWLTTPLVDAAQNAGCKVHLCVTNFGAGNNLALLGNPSARDTLIAQLIRLVAARGADGVNLDFESMPAAAREDLVIFCRDLEQRLQIAIPGAEISSAMPAVDWSGAWDVAELAKYIDVFFLMCYDYYWSGSSNAGPVSPIQGGSYNVTRTVDWYIAEGVPREQLVVGVPYYGFDWPVVSGSQNAATKAKAAAYIYSSIQNALKLHDRLWSDTFLNPWYKYNSASDWHQAWYDDTKSLAYKYDLVLNENLGGMGIWALSYDDGYDELWHLIEEKFTRPLAADVPQSATGLEIGAPWPNPVPKGIAVVQMNYRADTYQYPIAVRVVDVLGRDVYTDVISPGAASGMLTIPATFFSTGMYRVQLSSQGVSVQKTFVVHR